MGPGLCDDDVAVYGLSF